MNDSAVTPRDPPPDDEPAYGLWRLWRDGRGPDVREFLREAGGLAPARVVSALRVDQRERRRAGERVPARAYLGDFPELARDDELAFELVYCEYLLREELGERPTLEEYLRDYPEFAFRLRLQLDIHSALGPGRGWGDGDEPTLRVAPPRGADAPPRPLPRVAGFEVLRELGRGGMGVVYEACHARLHRPCALKMILAGDLATSDDVIRFLAEAEAVARLRHPNIVQIYSTGDHDGRPYLEMEYVEGGSLAARLDGTPWPPSGAARLVETLARAVHESHRLGIIHRDLKPANVLLAGDGTPKLADFGLAKALGADAGLTGTGEVLGTASYMAPEQAAARADEVGPGTDVYSLGAVLYELLTGRPPFRAATVFDTLEQVRTAEAVPPTRLQPGLPRDAETICLKCLAKDPARRYATALALADDLRRYLECRPIAARPVGKAERLWRWCLREPKVAGLVVMLALAVAGGFGGIAWAWRRAEAERRTAVVAMKRAEANFQKARDVVDDLSRTAASLAGRPELEKIRREILEKLVNFHASFLEEKSDDPAVIEQSALAEQRVAHIRKDLGQADRAIRAYMRSAELFERLLAQSPANPRFRSELAWSYFDFGVFQNNWQRKSPEAQASFKKAIGLAEGLAAAFPDEINHRSDLALYLTNWAAAGLDSGDLTGVEYALAHAITLERGILVASPGDLTASRHLALTLNHLSRVLVATDRRRDAESASRESVALLGRVVAVQNRLYYLRISLSMCQGFLATILEQTGRAAEAEDWRRRAYVDMRGLVESYPDVVDYRAELAKDADAYACLIDSTGRHDQAAEVYRVALHHRAKLAADFPENGLYQNELAWALATSPLVGLRDPGRAVRLAKKAVSLSRGSANFLNTLGVAQYRAGDLQAAKDALEKAIALRKADDVSDWLFLAMTCWKLGDEPQARGWYTRAIRRIEAKHVGDDETRRFREEAEALIGSAGEP